LGYDIDLGAQVSNHGIGWDTVTGLKSRLPQMLRHSPDKVFILIGTNDIGYGRDVGEMAAELAVILDTFKREKPDTKLYVQSVMPREAENMTAVNRINTAYKALAEVKGVTFIDLAPSFAAIREICNEHTYKNQGRADCFRRFPDGPIFRPLSRYGISQSLCGFTPAQNKSYNSS